MVKIAYVKWLDARGHGGSKTLGEAKKMKGLVLKSVGILVSQDKEAIRIAQDTYIAEVEEGVIMRDLEIIPSKYIISKKILTVEE